MEHAARSPQGQIQTKEKHTVLSVKISKQDLRGACENPAEGSPSQHLRAAVEPAASHAAL